MTVANNNFSLLTPVRCTPRTFLSIGPNNTLQLDNFGQRFDDWKPFIFLAAENA